MATILSISYDSSLLLTRQLLLEQMGHEVFSAKGFSRAYDLCGTHGHHFDLIVLRHSIPHDDKIAIAKHYTSCCVCPVLASLRGGEAPIQALRVTLRSNSVRQLGIPHRRQGPCCKESATWKPELIKDSPGQPFFRPGEPILETGIYRVFHGEHRVTHEVTLLKGQSFPHCRECGGRVHFELVRAAPEIDRNDFGVRLYQLPHPTDEEEQTDAAAAS